jgi:hypothetical protein
MAKLNRKCQNSCCTSSKIADTWCEFSDQSSETQVGWLCIDCVRPTTKAAAFCRAKALRPQMSLADELEKGLAKMFDSTGWQLVSDRHLGKVAVSFDECSVEFQLQSELKV